MKRRNFLKAAGSTAAALAARGWAMPAKSAHGGPILDAHIHLFNPGRPGGVPWPKPDDLIYKSSLPDRYEPLAAPFGVVGAIAIEASPLPEDNDWVLGVAERSPVMVGVIGDLVPGSASFHTQLERLHRNPLFLGIRYGNLWDRNLAQDMGKPGFMNGLGALAQAGLTFETANPDAGLIEAVVKVGGKFPTLRIVIDHMPHAEPPTQADVREVYDRHLHALGQRPGTYIKLSEIPVKVDGKLVQDPGIYRAKLEALWEAFGEDKVLFGSDWPNSDHEATYSETMAIVRSYMDTKSTAAQHKYFFANSIHAYKWKPRRPAQRGS